MALVTLALYATGGHTEVGGLQQFLARWLPGVDVRRKFPAAALKKKLGAPAPADRHAGVTGADLVRRAVRQIEEFGLGGADGVLLVDDADCRFGCEMRTGLPEAVARIVHHIRDAAQAPELPVFVLFSSPEIEAWFLTDLKVLADERLRGLHGCADVTALRHVLHPLFPEPEPGWEAFGCPEQEGGGCTTKLSAALADVLFTLPGPPDRRRYSKRDDGQLLLKLVDPHVIAERCRHYARPPLLALKTWASGASTNGA